MANLLVLCHTIIVCSGFRPTYTFVNVYPPYLKARLIEKGEEASLAAIMTLAREEERAINDCKLAKMEYQEDEDDEKKPSPKQLKIVWGKPDKLPVPV